MVCLFAYLSLLDIKLTPATCSTIFLDKYYSTGLTFQGMFVDVSLHSNSDMSVLQFRSL